MSLATLLLDSNADACADYALTPHAALLVTETGNGFVFDMAGEFYAVPPVGAVMLRHALESGEDRAVAEIAALYEADAATVRTDLRGLLANLMSRGVIRSRDEAAAPARRSLGARVIARMARLALALPGPTLQAGATLTLSRLSFMLFGWAATLAAWRDAMPAAARESGVTYAAIDEAVRSVSARLPFGGACKERALSAFVMARRAGLPASVVVGVVQYPLGAHAWCEAAPSTILGDEIDNCARYRAVFRYE